MVRIHDLSNNKVTDREMTDEEFAAYEADQISIKTAKSDLAAKEKARDLLLEKLGITADEAALLLG
ncbi:hypothetical protein UFOVP1665_13 [uncultured Caudovirales phage]|uniref:Uncharacterized protein n=1 Tax=uncultured Caudovirales phage TaxID=2100421 RepID=A0A6J5T5V8_9CAUD|nr:hypothetical protein UFOVP1665_13 [uncultured Caudovirales phage]